MEIKRVAACGCSYMTSSRHIYLKLQGPDWPEHMPWNLADLPDFVRKELKDFGYIHNPSFLDLATQELGWQLTYFSQPGASNFMIRKQIDSVIKEGADLAIVAATAPMRVDLDQEDKNLCKYYYLNQDVERDILKSYYFMCGGLDQLEKAKIPYVFLPGPMKHMDWSQYNVVWPSTYMQPWDLQPMHTNIANHIPTQDHLNFYKTLTSLIA
jgi:hypothetical protein